MIKISIIAALSRNLAIGKDNNLLWHLPEDLKRFKAITLEKPIVMGRKTYDSIGRPLPGRTNIVVTRNVEWQASGVHAELSLEAALAAAREICQSKGATEIMVIGGEQIYRAALPFASKLYLTEVDAVVDGDAFFPLVELAEWREIERTASAESTKYGYQFVTLERITRQ